MTENDLKQLKDLPVPPPAEGARNAGIAVFLRPKAIVRYISSDDAYF